MKTFTTYLCIPVAVVVGLLCQASTTHAAQFIVQSPPLLPVEETFSVSVFLNTEGQTINALDGVLRYPSAFVLQEIRDGNSLINFWIERPNEVADTIHFSGITPSGFNGKGEVFVLVFKALRAPKDSFVLSDAHTLLNDGNGTPTRLSLLQESGTTTLALITDDKTSPELFTPSLGSDSSLFDGKYFLVFASQDKQSGIAYYEVAESSGFQWFGLRSLVWQRVASPYVVSDQALHSHLYVRAVDRAGNSVAAELSPTHPPFYEKKGTLLVILLVGIAILIYVRKQKRARKI
jgi:hypothetical protein